MGQGIRTRCHRCQSTKYDYKHQVCNACGWRPEGTEKSLKQMRLK